MRANASPLFDAEGKASGVIVSVRDITVEKKLEQQIIQSERLAAMGQMIGGFAHELNNPLTSIMGVAELLQEGEQDETRRKHLVMLQQQARRAAEIVQNLMYFSRPPAPGKRSGQPERTGAADSAPARLLAAQKQYYGGFSAGTGHCPVVTGDSHQLMQIFLNLILNAEQAMREARDRGTLRIRLEKNGRRLRSSFRTTGLASPPRCCPTSSIRSIPPSGRGVAPGLGLSICKAILREHGGEIEGSSGPGGGAVFKVTLPVSAASYSVKSLPQRCPDSSAGCVSHIREVRGQRSPHGLLAWMLR